MPNGDFEVLSSVKDDDLAFNILSDLLQRRDRIPLSEIKARTHINDEFFAILHTASNLAAIDSPVLFRKKDDAESIKTSIWLSLVLNQAKHDALTFGPNKFKGLSIDSLRYVSKLSSDEKNLHRIKDVLLKELGIVLIIEKSLSAMKLDGMATLLTDGTPVIGLSVRYPRYDYFWFTLLHELAHIALHYEQLEDPILDDLDSGEPSDVEMEANRLAADSLVPRRIWDKAAVHRSLNETDLLDLARQAEIHPVIAAGLVRRKHNDYKLYSRLVNQINVRKFLGID